MQMQNANANAECKCHIEECLRWPLAHPRDGGDVHISDLTLLFLAGLLSTEFLLPPPHGTGSLLPGSSVIQTHRRDLVSLPTGHIALADPGHLKEQDSEEPKASVVQAGSGVGGEGVSLCFFSLVACVITAMCLACSVLPALGWHS